MANRFTKVTPVEYIPIDTNLLFKAGLYKDQQEKQDYDKIKKSYDFLANQKTNYETDFEYKNSAFNALREGLKETVKNTESFQSPLFKTDLNNKINSLYSDPTFWKGLQRTKRYEEDTKAMADPKNDISYNYSRLWENSVEKQSNLSTGDPSTNAMINHPRPSKVVNLNEVMLKDIGLITAVKRFSDDGSDVNKISSTFGNGSPWDPNPTTNSAMKIIDPSDPEGKREIILGRKGLLAQSNLYNNPNAMRELVYEYKANEGLTFYDPIDPQKFEDFTNKKIINTVSLLDTYDELSGIGSFKKALFNNQLKETTEEPKIGEVPASPGRIVDEDNHVSTVNKSLTDGKADEIELDSNGNGIGYNRVVKGNTGNSFSSRDSAPEVIKVPVSDVNINKSINDKFEVIRKGLQKQVYATGMNSSPYNSFYTEFSKNYTPKQRYDAIKKLYSGIVSNAEALPTTGVLKQKEFAKEILFVPGATVSNFNDSLKGTGFTDVNQNSIKTLKVISDGMETSKDNQLVSYIPSDPLNGFEPIFIYSQGPQKFNVSVSEPVKTEMADVTEAFKKLQTAQLYSPTPVYYDGDNYQIEWVLDANGQKASSVYKYIDNSWKAVNIGANDLAQKKMGSVLLKYYRRLGITYPKNVNNFSTNDENQEQESNSFDF